MEEIIFNIAEVAAILGLRVLKHSGRNTLCVCPFCGDTRGKFAYNESKNRFNCFHCDKKGGAVSLYALVKDETDFTKAARELHQIFNGNETPEISVSYKKPETKNIEKKPDEYLNKVYKALLNMLTLKEEHKLDLLKRGLTEAQIKYFGYKSTPENKYEVCKSLKRQGYDLEGVPGFYKTEKGYYTMSKADGYFCPVFKDKMIIGFQIRVDKPIDGNKYLWFSSYNCSCGGLITKLDGKSNVTVITEGINKAIITYALLKGKVTVIGVPGIKVTGGLKDILKGHSNYIYEAFDMDKAIRTEDEKEKLKSERINKAAEDLRKMVEDMDIPVSPLNWDYDKEAYWKGNFKGIDDFLLSYGEENILTKFIPYLTEKASKKLKLIEYFKKEACE